MKNMLASPCTFALLAVAVITLGLALSCRSERRMRDQPGLRVTPTYSPTVSTYPDALLHGSFAVWGAGRIKNTAMHASFRDLDSDPRYSRTMPSSHMSMSDPRYHGPYDAHGVYYKVSADRPGYWSFGINIEGKRGRSYGGVNVHAKAGNPALGDVIFCESLLSIYVIGEGAGNTLFPLINRYDARFHFVDDLRLVEDLSPSLVVLHLRLFESESYESIADSKRILDAFVERGASIVIMAGGFAASAARANAFLNTYGIRYVAQDELEDLGIEFPWSNKLTVRLDGEADVFNRDHPMGQTMFEDVEAISLVRPWPLVVQNPDSVLAGDIWGAGSDVAFIAASDERPTVLAVGMAGIGGLVRDHPYDNTRLLDNILKVTLGGARLREAASSGKQPIAQGNLQGFLQSER